MNLAVGADYVRPPPRPLLPLSPFSLLSLPRLLRPPLVSPLRLLRVSLLSPASPA